MILLSAAVFKHVLQLFAHVARAGQGAPGRALGRTVQDCPVLPWVLGVCWLDPLVGVRRGTPFAESSQSVRSFFQSAATGVAIALGSVSTN